MALLLLGTLEAPQGSTRLNAAQSSGILGFPSSWGRDWGLSCLVSPGVLQGSPKPWDRPLAQCLGLPSGGHGVSREPRPATHPWAVSSP